MATKVCSTQGIHVTFEEVLPGSDDLGAYVVHDTDVFGIRMKGVTLPTAPRAISAGDHGQGGTEFGGQRHGPYSAGTEGAIARASSIRCCGTNGVKQMGPESVSGDVGPCITGVKRAVRPKKAPEKEDEYTKNQLQKQEMKRSHLQKMNALSAGWQG